MKKYMDKDGVLGYPAAIKEMPYCCWRYEKQNGRYTKVPYNAKTGCRAKTDTPDTFCGMEEALRAVGNYSGIGFNIDKDSPIGCIDLDHCLTDDILSDAAKAVLGILPGALAEVSPSETGLHLFFQIPDGFSFNTDVYYINNRKQKMEIYLPREKAHFMTLTGAVYRTGDMVVTEGQLKAFLDTYMRRKSAMAPAALPAGGSVLTDGQVIQKIASEPDPKFIDMYNGYWEPYGEGPDWSQSDADMTVLMKLAFYCRGDMEQMDRLFRASGLMRDKWDRSLGDSTYGVFSMTNAVNTCSAFYEPPAHSSTEEDFSCAALIDRLLESSPLTTETATAEDTLEAAAWAYHNDLQRYSLLRQAIPKGVGIRNFERAVKQHITPEAPSVSFLTLKGVSTPGMIVPPGWIVDDHGVSHLELAFGEYKPMPVSPEPLFISAKMVNVDDGTEKLEVTFRRNGSYKTLIAPRSDMLNKNSIIRYADAGLPVSSGTAGNLTKFIAEMEAANNRVIPLKRCIRRAGWVGTPTSLEFFPYYLRSPMTGQEDDENAERFLEHLKTEGDEGVWLDMAAKVRTMPFARAMLAASFASPLLYHLQHRNIYYHSWFDSKSGKTAALKFAMSVWGDPSALVKSYFSTMVGMEHRAGTMKHLPLALDELQTLEKRMDVNNMVYTLGNGVGKTRGRAGGGIRAIDDWRNCILSTGEQPISTDNSMDGVNTRLLEVYAAPVPDQNLAMQMHQVAERNFGFAGEKFIRWIVEKVIMASSEGCGKQGEDGHSGVDGGKDDHKDNHSGGSRLQTDYETIRSALDMIFGDRYVGAENIAVIALADYYASMAVFGLDHGTAFGEALELGAAIMDARKQEDHTDTVDRAWVFVTGWVAANKKRFGDSLYSPPEYFGTTEGGKLYAIASTLNNALEEAGFSYKKCIRGFGQRGYIGTFTDSEGKKRTQMVKRVNGVNARVYQLNVTVEKEDEEPPFPD